MSKQSQELKQLDKEIQLLVKRRQHEREDGQAHKELTAEIDSLVDLYATIVRREDVQSQKQEA